MADLVITAGNVVADSAASKISGTAGETITAGMAVYQDTSTKKWMKALSDSAAHAAASGIALNGASLNQPLSILTEGTITIGATVTVGETYYVSNTAGGIIPYADLSAAEYVTMIGIGLTASTIAVKFIASGVAVPGA